jgi:hypothetical protein
MVVVQFVERTSLGRAHLGLTVETPLRAWIFVRCFLLCPVLEYEDLLPSFSPKLRDVTIKFANSPTCVCRGSSEQKPQFGLMTLAYQVYYLGVVIRLREKLDRNDPNFCQQLMDLASRQCTCSRGTVCEGVFS